MSMANFIPTLWSARLLEHLNKTHVYGALVNRDYEGEIKEKGNTVKINSIGDVSIGDYARNTDMSPPEVLSGTTQTLEITQGKYFNFQIDDVDKAQQTPKIMDKAMQRSSYAMSDLSDRYIAGFYTDTAAANLIGNDTTPVSPTKDNAYDYLVDLSVKLDEADVPSEGRWVVIPAWFYGLLQKDPRFISAGTSATDAVLRNGRIGEAAGFTVHKSNNVPNTGGAKYKIMAGHNMAISFAEQIVRVEAYRPEKRFADAVKGLHVYGAKVLVPKALAVLTANKA